MYKNKLFSITLLLSITSSYSYIDPGTGGYLLSSLWSSLVAFFALVIGVTIRFFRHTLTNFLKTSWREHKLKSIGIIILSIVLLIYFLIPQEKEGGLIIDNREGVFTNQDDEFYFLYHGGLYNQDGEEIKTWNYSYLSLIDSEGYYYAQEHYESENWGKFHFNGTPIWTRPDKIHHEIYETQDKEHILTTGKEVHMYKGREVEFDTILKVHKNGTLVDYYSIYEHLEDFQQWHRKLELDNPIDVLLPENHKKENKSIWGGYYDYYHLNSISEVPNNSMEGFHPAFNPGNLIISFRHGSMIFILDKNTKEILWMAIYDQIENNLEGQHAPKMNKNGNIVVFDNGRYREQSRIIEINTVDLSIETLYEADDFFTGSQGYVQPLENGNLFITESEEGRVFEINNQGEIIWEYLKPTLFENRSDAHPTELEIYRAYKYDKEFIETLLFK